MWQTENDKGTEWDYKLGLLGTAFIRLYQNTQNRIYINYVIQYAESVIDSSGQILDYRLEDYNIDMINPGKMLFYLYDFDQDPRYLQAMQTLRAQMVSHPRTPSGGFWHKKIYPNQMWLDGLYMGAPFYAHYNTKYEDGDQLEDITHQFQLIYEKTKDPETGLLYHAWDESKQMEWADPSTGQSPNFWSRSIGWYMMAMVDVLDYYPVDHPDRKEIISILLELTQALVSYQDDSGLWFQVTDMEDREGNYLEASSSCMFAYALAKGAHRGYLPDYFLTIAQKAFDGIVNQLITIDPDGEIHITQVCGSAGLGGNPYRDGSYEYYISEPIKTDNLHGLGPFILAALELNQ